MRVYRKGLFRVLLEVLLRLGSGLPWIIMGSPLGAAAGYWIATRQNLSAWWILAGALWVLPVVLVHAGLALRELRQRIELDPDRGEVRFYGFVWWRPWTRPRLGPLTMPLERVVSVELFSWARGYRIWMGPAWRPMRVIGDGAIVDVPRLVPRREALRGVLSACARANGPIEPTEDGYKRLIVVAAMIGYGVAFVVVLGWLGGVF